LPPEESWFSKWKKKRKAEKEFKRGIMEEARQEALKDMKPELVAHMKQKELDKLTGKSDFLNKIGKELEKIGKKDIGGMMSSGNRAGPNMSLGGGTMMSPDKISSMFGNNKPKPKPRAKRKITKKKKRQKKND